MFQDQFYFHLIRKYVILFGTLFKDTFVGRYDDNGVVIGKIAVPVQYAPKDKMFVRLLDNPDGNRDYATLLPRMSFEIVQPGFQYDANRKLGSIQKWVQPNTANLGVLQRQYQPMPFDISFALYVYANDMEDALKIIEGIVPNFTPDWTANVWLIPEINEKRDIPIIMTGGPVMTDIYDKDFKERRMITFTLNFTMKAWLFGPIKQKPIIKFIDVNVSAVDREPVDPLNATLDFIIDGQATLLANGSPTSNIAQSIPVTEISILNDYGFGEVVNVVIAEGISLNGTTVYPIPDFPGIFIVDSSNTQWQFDTSTVGNNTVITSNGQFASPSIAGTLLTIQDGILWYQVANGNWFQNISNSTNFTPHGNTGPR